MKLANKLILSLLAVMLVSRAASAAHPLITDDAGTTGRGNFLFELNGETVESETLQLNAALTYGAAETLDIVLGVPYVMDDENGVADASVDMKWRFYTNGPLSLALRPGVSLPIGDEERGLGAGKPAYSVFLITTGELEPAALHFNLGYIRNESDFDERRNIYHVSLAAESGLTEKITAVANVGIETNPDKSTDINPAFLLAGAVYSITDKIDIDAGYKLGLTDAEPSYSILAGVAVTF